MRRAGLIFGIFVLATAPAAAAPFHEPNAVIVNVTQADLNLILREVFHAKGADRIAGDREALSRGVSDFHYEAGFSEPTLQLYEDGRARLDLDLLEANLTIGRIERKVLARRMLCENAGVSIREPVDVTLDFRFAIENDDLRVVPEDLTLANKDRFRLHRPARCKNNPLPEFLMWWLGKGRLRKKIDGLDDVLLAKARRGADELAAEKRLMSKRWLLDTSGAPGSAAEVHLYPRSIDTSHGSLLISLAGSSPGPIASEDGIPNWVAGHTTGSFLGLSETFLNRALQLAFGELDGSPKEPSGHLRKLFRSDAVLALIPGLRRMESRDDLRIGFDLHTPPRIEFDSRDGRAVIRMRLADAEMSVWDASDWLGSVAIDGATIAVLPYRNRLGGISFDVTENAWNISSSGIEFDEEILAATFQELFFGEMFETRFEPVGGDALEVGATRFDPAYFTHVDRHLVIGLAGF